ncbi:MAG: restriction endonuclease [Patescibacteria group bacterium]|nr:restriction endonuclease [Patescibacteria group bacterium]
MQNRTLYFGDNLEVLREKIPDESFDLIYLDPPFNSNRNYNVIFKEGMIDSSAQTHVFEDSWHWTPETQKIFDYLVTKTNESISSLMQSLAKVIGLQNDMTAYLTMMTIRLIELRRVLKPTGSIYLHCDPTASHYLKIVMDAIFGKKYFQNEIIWHYKRWPAKQNRFQRMHDTILFYSKKEVPAIFNVMYSPLAEITVKIHKGKKQLAVVEDGRRLSKDQLHNSDGTPMDDVWDISTIAGNAKERLGYPTQKPEALLERIVKASSKEGDWVLDPFCGCGTTVAVAEKLNRNWIGIDVSSLAIKVIKDRLSQEFQSKALLQKINIDGLPKDLSGAKLLAQKNPWDFEYWALLLAKGAIPAKNKTQENMKGADKGIDGIITFLKNINKNEYGKIIIQVKSGHVQRNQIAILKGDVDREKAEGGLFITLEEPTRPMKDEAVSAGGFTVDFAPGKEFPKIQILTINELLNGRQPDLPYGMIQNHFKTAVSKESENNHNIFNYLKENGNGK